MGSIAVDKAIAKLGTPKEFTSSSRRDQIAEHIVQVFEPDMPAMIDDIMRREHPATLARPSPRARQAVIGQVQAQLPGVVRTVTDEIGEHIDQLLDPKIMVINHFQSNPAWWCASSATSDRGAEPDGRLRVRLRLRAGRPGRDRRPLVRAVVAAAGARRDRRLGHQRTGHVADLRMAEEKRILGIKVHGLFLRRQDQAAEMYARIIADDVITLENIGDFLLDGPAATAPGRCSPTR